MGERCAPAAPLTASRAAPAKAPRSPRTGLAPCAIFHLLSAQNCTFQRFKQSKKKTKNAKKLARQLFLEPASRMCRPRPCGHRPVALQRGVSGAATHAPLIWAPHKVEPKCVRICGASRWLKCILKSNVISAPSLSGDSDFQSVLKNRNKTSRGNTGAFLLGWKSPGLQTFRHLCTCALPSCLVRHNGSHGCWSQRNKEIKHISSHLEKGVFFPLLGIKLLFF